MEETKRCPYCGEEILAIAKKCKHCGEWLEEKPERETIKNTITEPKEVHVEEKIVPNADDSEFYRNISLSKTIIQLAFWAAVIGLVITTAHGLISEDNGSLFDGLRRGRAGRMQLLLNICNIIPEWIGNVLEGGGVIVMLLAIKEAMSKKSENIKSLFSSYIYATGAVAICYIVVDFVEYEYDAGILGITGFLFVGVQMILQIILGLKISNVYSGTVNYLGKVMYICGGIQLLSFVIGVAVAVVALLEDNEDVLYWSTLAFTMVDAFVLYFYYSVLKGTLIQSEEE